MAVLLFSVGTFALVAGLVMVGFGIPINEFSFGNTLINAGITAAVGGLIVIALGVAVGQLRRIAEVLAGDLPAGYAQPMDLAEATGASSPAAGIPDRIPFPPRPRSETPPPENGIVAECTDEYCERGRLRSVRGANFAQSGRRIDVDGG